METTQTPPPKKPGPVPHGYARANLLLPPDLLEWAKREDEGLSRLVRRLLADERRRRGGATV